MTHPHDPKSDCCGGDVEVRGVEAWGEGVKNFYVCTICDESCGLQEWAKAKRDGFEVPLIGVPKSAEPTDDLPELHNAKDNSGKPSLQARLEAHIARHEP